jgi:beta-lactamase class A
MLDGTEVYDHAAGIARPAASLIKVPLAMALVAAHCQHQCGHDGLDLDVVETLRDGDRVDGDGAFDAAPAGTRRTRWELIRHTLRESDNTAGNLLIRAIGMDATNHLLAEPPLSLSVTRIQRRFMDVAAAAAGYENLTSAREMCRLFALAASDPAYACLLEWLGQSPYDERLVSGVPVGTLVSHKVGDLDGIEHDAGIVYAPHAPYIVALLSVGLPAPGDGNRTIAEASRLIYGLISGTS